MGLKSFFFEISPNVGHGKFVNEGAILLPDNSANQMRECRIDGVLDEMRSSGALQIECVGGNASWVSVSSSIHVGCNYP